jgi:hypothetical protein
MMKDGEKASGRKKQGKAMGRTKPEMIGFPH